MQQLLNLGRWLFPLSFLFYVGLHFGQAEMGASFVPAYLPSPLFWNYFTGTCVLLFIVSALLGKHDQLATLLMALYVFLMIILVHLPRAASDQNDALNIFRNIMVISALIIYAKYLAKDRIIQKS